MSQRSRNQMRPFKRVRRVFDADTLKEVCEAHETDFSDAYGMDEVECPASAWSAGDFYAFKDNESSVLAVGHLDTVVAHSARKTTFVDTEAGPVVHSGALDDRLGVYIILHMLPALGINVDVLLTTGEEDGCSTGQFFDPRLHFEGGKTYDHIIEFDRGGSDVVMYQYDDWKLDKLVKDSGARTAHGAFSDISYMEHLATKAMNWGVGYKDYHSTRGHAYLWDTFEMVSYYLNFHAANVGTHLPHKPKPPRPKYGYSSGYSSPNGYGNKWREGAKKGGQTYGGHVSAWQEGDTVDDWMYHNGQWHQIVEGEVTEDYQVTMTKPKDPAGWVKVNDIWVQESSADPVEEVLSGSSALTDIESERERYAAWWLDQEAGWA